jgi:prevent-host-death family protein
MRTSPRFSEDVVPVGDLKVNPGRVVQHVDRTRRPVLLTSRGRGVAVVQALGDFERDAEEREFLRAVVQGLLEIDEGRDIDLTTVKAQLGIA